MTFFIHTRVRNSAVMLLLMLTVLAAGCDSGTSQQAVTDPGQAAQPTATTANTSSGSGDSSGSSGTKPGTYKVIDLTNADACSYITREEAEGLMGTLDWAPNPDSGVMGTAVGTKRCTYDPAFKEDSQQKALLLDLWPTDSWLVNDAMEGKNIKGIAASEVGLDGETFPRASKYDYLPPVCGNKTPCVFSNETMDWVYVYAILPDRTAVSVKVVPKDVSIATKLVKRVLEQAPFK